ncbi:deoxycytidyl transferase [Actinomortierella ambigua]|uniref:DNA repair protein REV1 n=1 Tax=Actinomortierella ambigua TaxID=1343610 RepID=A0A9P6Q190_9FUNG|nr:deoxycytidyl transferase [Actinomortierella ambigua]
MADDPDDDHYAGVSFGDFGTYMRHKKRKLQDQFDLVAAKAPKELPQIFEGVVFYINGFTVPPIHGGEYRQYLSKSQITHIIAMNLTQAKMNEFKNYKVVRPEWVLDSIKAGMRLPWHRYSVLRVAGSLQQFGTRLVAPASQQGSSLIRDNSGSPSLSAQHDSLAFRPNEADLVPSAPKFSPTSSHSMPPPPPPPPTTLPSLPPSDLSSDEPGPDDDEIELMVEDEEMEWDGIDLAGLDEPLSLSPATPRRSQHMTVVDDDDGNDLKFHPSLHQATESSGARSELPSSPAFTGTIGPGSNVGFKLIRVRRSHITPSPVGSLEGETEESFADLSFAEDSRLLRIDEDEEGREEGEGEENEATSGRAGQIEKSSVTGAAGASNIIDHRHPTLIELSNAWNRKNSSVVPGFVAKFFRSSRLHYLSTWKAKLREMMADIQKKDHKITKVKPQNQCIMHIDFDCFFASVGTRDRPELAGKPVGVAHGSGGANSNSEIASCNYLARGFGVKNGMQLKRARSLCPDLVVVPYEFEKYESISLEFYRILLQYADDLQAVSVDEALVDISSRVLPTWNDYELGTNTGASSSSSSSPWPGTTPDVRIPPEEFAQRLRDEIFAATGCQASVGIGPNILLAKLSTKRAKPHGQYIWPSIPGSDRTILELQGDEGEGSQAAKGEGLGMANVSLFVSPPAPNTSTPDEANAIQESSATSPSSSTSSNLPHPPTQPAAGPVPRPKEPRKGGSKGNGIKLLPGVGHRTAQELEERFLVKTIFELQQVERAKLQEYCGMKTGDMLYKACRGIDDTQITADQDKKRQSVSAEISWGVRFENDTQVERFVQDLSVEVSHRLRDIGRKAKSLVIKIMKRKQYVQGHWKHLGHGPVDQYARTGQLPNYTDDPETIAEEAMRLIHFFKFSPLDLRGIGIQMVKLDHGPQGSLASHSFLYDSVQQTTLAAMFSKQRVANEQKRLEQGPHEESEGPVTRADSSIAGLTMTIPLRPPSPAPLPEMEIDRATFEELPENIRQDLSRHHQLKFLSQSSTAALRRASTTSPPPHLPPPPHVQVDELLGDNEGDGIASSSPSSPLHSAHPSLPPWSQVDPDTLIAMSTPMIRKTLGLYADNPRRRVATLGGRAGVGDMEAEEEEEDKPTNRTTTTTTITTTTTTPVRRSVRDALANDKKVLPSPSKLDLSVLQELPDDIRAEIEQEYNAMQENQRLIAMLAAGEGASGSSTTVGNSGPRHGDGSGSDGGEGVSGVSAGKGPATTKAATTTTITGRRRGRPAGSKNKKLHEEVVTGAGANSAPHSTSTTMATVNGHRSVTHPEDEADDEAGEEEEGGERNGDSGLPPPPPPLDPEFLAALPPDLRAEIEANHQAELSRYRLQQLQQQSKKGRQTNKKLPAMAAGIGGDGSRNPSDLTTSVMDPPRSPTTASMTTTATMTDTTADRSHLRPTLDGEREIGPLRQMVTQWVQSTLVATAVLEAGDDIEIITSVNTDTLTSTATTQADSVSIQVDKGPNPEDVSDFIEFLVRVVAMERDLDRVRLLVRWLQRKVAESEASLAQSHHLIQQWWMMRQGRLEEGQEVKRKEEEEKGSGGGEEDEKDEPDTSLGSNASALAMLLHPSSQPAMTWRQALAQIEMAVQGVVRQMYGGTVDLSS